jgi:formylmethanofuran dehydrogenase subunit E
VVWGALQAQRRKIQGDDRQMTEKYRKYHVTIEGDLETNMTAEEIKEEAHANVEGWSFEKQKVTVKPIAQKKRKETTR